MIVEATAIPDVMVLAAPVYRDSRGFFNEVYHEEVFAKLCLPTHFVQDNHSRSARHVLRGLHCQMQQPQGKLVRPVCGTIFDVAVDLRKSSKYFGRWVGVTLDAGDGRQVWIPPGFAHGFYVLSESADVTYKCTTPYHAASNRSLRWDDADLAIEWPLSEGSVPILSDADANAPRLSEFEPFG